MKALIFAAGLGTRLQPLTNNKPKALVELKGESFLKRAIQKLKAEGINEFVINIHHFGDLILQYLKENNNFDSIIHISDERDFLLDTGGGLKKASIFFDKNEDFIIYNVDIFSDIKIKDLMRCHKKSNALITLAVQSRVSDRRLIFDENKFLCGWENIDTNRKKIAREISGNAIPVSFSGIHAVSGKIFDLITEIDKFSIIDLYMRLAKDYKISYYNHDYSYVIDLGKHENIIEAEKYI